MVYPADSAKSKCTTPEEGASGAKVYHAEGGRPEVKVYQAPIGSEAPAAEAAVAAKQLSCCEPWRDVILGKLEAGLTAQRIYQDLMTGYGFPGKYHSVRRFVRRLTHSQPLPFRRMECAPGAEAQVDFGRGIPITGPDGKRRHTHVFRIVLSHSRKGYSEVVYRLRTLRALLTPLGATTISQRAWEQLRQPRKSAVQTS
jgi:hypothetical protein